ncbi:MAG: hypothetical protein ACRYFS_25175 [Janthinobacterium lividum]
MASEVKGKEQNNQNAWDRDQQYAFFRLETHFDQQAADNNPPANHEKTNQQKYSMDHAEALSMRIGGCGVD